MKKGKRILSIFVSLCVAFSMLMPIGAFAAADSDIVILHTNDVHTYIDGSKGFDYSQVAALKKSYKNALLADAGDHIQGTAFGSMDQGKTVIELMEKAGYDVATLGNHEFDYGMLRALDVATNSAYPYVSCNFYNEKDGVKGDPVLDSYKIFEKAGKKIAFVGITTPESFTKSTPAYFQNEKGEYIYGIAGGTDGKELYDAVQTAINAAKAEGADYIIALGHLGNDASSSPWTSEEVIANVTGLNAFIDGHSHETITGKEVKDKDGNTVILSQTGEYLGAIGKIIIAADGKITAELLTDKEGVAQDKDVKAVQDAWVESVNTLLGEVIGSTSVVFDNYDANGDRLVRKQETNTGDFAADALYYLFDNMNLDVDVAVMNGGGVRNKAVTGDISYLTCKSIHTFGNVACLQQITGQQLLDALEWGAREYPNENGGFLHVSGVKYRIDPTIESTVQMDEKGVWTGGPTGKYRVYDVKIYDKKKKKYVALDLKKKYNIAGYNYTLRDLGDGFAMFKGAVNILDYVMEDYQVLANYVKSFPVDKTTGLPTITAANSPYDKLTGEGRIEIIDRQKADVKDALADVKVSNTSKSVKNGIKITAKIAKGSKSVDKLKEKGYTIKYRFYRSEKKTSDYKSRLTKPENVFINNSLKKNTKYYYKTKVMVYDGKTLIGSTTLGQSSYTSEIWK